MDKFPDKLILLGTGISVVVALVLYIAKVDTVLSLIIGMLGIILSLQIDFIARLEKLVAKNTMDQMIVGKIGDMPEYQEYLVDIINHTYTVSNSISNEILRQSSFLEMERFSTFLHNLSQGKLHTGPGDNDAIITLMAQAEKEVVITSPTAINMKWWPSPMGSKFWDANVEALKRRVAITRIFLIDHQGEQVQAVMKEQMIAGINVFWVDLNELPIELRIGLAVFDNDVGYQLIQNPDGRVSEYIFTVDDKDIHRMLRSIERIKFMAKPYTIPALPTPNGEQEAP